MVNERIELTQYRYQRAVETLEVAEELFENGRYRDSNNRSYYAAFYAIRAVYAMQGIDFKKHKTMIATFNKEFVATEIFPRTLGKGISTLQLIREQSDYNDMYVASKQECEMQIATAKQLIALVKDYLIGQGVEL